MLEDDFEAGKILKPDEDVDNKQLMKEKSNVSE